MGRRLCCLARNAASAAGEESRRTAIAVKRSRRSRPSARSAHPRPRGARACDRLRGDVATVGAHGKKRPRRSKERRPIAHQRCQSRPVTVGPVLASRRANGRLRVTEKGMWPLYVSSGRPRTGVTVIASGRRRSGIGRRISSISRVSCAARSSRVAFASASSARLRSAAFCVASCRS